jgi:hypothetical protein
VNADDDTVLITNTEATSLEGLRLADATADSPWSRALGTTAQWIWILENQQGYADGIQFAFALNGTEVARIQLIAAGSHWHIGAIRP